MRVAGKELGSLLQGGEVRRPQKDVGEMTATETKIWRCVCLWLKETWGEFLKSLWSLKFSFVRRGQKWHPGRLIMKVKYKMKVWKIPKTLPKLSDVRPWPAVRGLPPPRKPPSGPCCSLHLAISFHFHGKLDLDDLEWLEWIELVKWESQGKTLLPSLQLLSGKRKRSQDFPGVPAARTECTPAPLQLQGRHR